MKKSRKFKLWCEASCEVGEMVFYNENRCITSQLIDTFHTYFINGKLLHLTLLGSLFTCYDMLHTITFFCSSLHVVPSSGFNHLRPLGYLAPLAHNYLYFFGYFWVFQWDMFTFIFYTNSLTNTIRFGQLLLLICIVGVSGWRVPLPLDSLFSS